MTTRGKTYDSKPAPLISALAAAALTFEPIGWLIETWLETTCDSIGLCVFAIEVALFLWSVASKLDRLVPFLKNLALAPLAMTALVRMIGIRASGECAFSVGIAAGCFLLSQVTHMGRGYARYVGPAEASHAEATDVAKPLGRPVLSDIPIDGNVDCSTSKTLPLIWARARIAEHMREHTRPPQRRAEGLRETALRERVTALEGNFSVNTQWSSFVAISKRAVNDSLRACADAQLTFEQVEGASEHAYGNAGTAADAPLRVPSARCARTLATHRFATNDANLERFGRGASPGPGIYGG